MNGRFLIALLVLFSACKWNQSIRPNAITIENQLNRGTNYTDSNGVDFNLRYIPVSITNNSCHTAKLKLNFLKEYQTPDPENKHLFKLNALPEEWAMDGVDLTASMMDQLSNYLASPTLNKLIQAGETFTLAIASLYPRPVNFSGVLPQALVTNHHSEQHKDCLIVQTYAEPKQSNIPLMLKISVGDNCSLIPCRQIKFITE